MSTVNIQLAIAVDRCFHWIFKIIMTTEVEKKDGQYIFNNAEFVKKYSYLCDWIE
jgi:hypothetical protein